MGQTLADRDGRPVDVATPGFEAAAEIAQATYMEKTA
jgi:hypothetical protein